MIEVLLIGGGVAAGYTAKAFEEQGALGNKVRLTVISKEAALPYERPALSKGYLLNDAVRPPKFNTVVGTGGPRMDPAWYAKNNVTLLTGRSVQSLNLKSKYVTLAPSPSSFGTTAVPFDVLIIATGCGAATLPCAASVRQHVHYLRSLHDAEALVARAAAVRAQGGHIVIVGGGHIAAEVACALSQRSSSSSSSHDSSSSNSNSGSSNSNSGNTSNKRNGYCSSTRTSSGDHNSSNSGSSSISTNSISNSSSHCGSHDSNSHSSCPESSCSGSTDTNNSESTTTTTTSSSSTSSSSITVLCPGPHLLAGVIPAAAAQHYAAAYAQHGVHILPACRASHIEAPTHAHTDTHNSSNSSSSSSSTNTCTVVLQDNSATPIPAAMVIVGIGSKPRSELLRNALPEALTSTGAIAVDGNFRIRGSVQTDLRMYAVGDVAAFPKDSACTANLSDEHLQRAEQVAHARASAAHVVRAILEDSAGNNIRGYTYTPSLYSRVYSFGWRRLGSTSSTCYTVGSMQPHMLAVYTHAPTHTVTGVFLESQGDDTWLPLLQAITAAARPVLNSAQIYCLQQRAYSVEQALQMLRSAVEQQQQQQQHSSTIVVRSKL